MNEIIHTYGFDLKQIVAEARENGNNEFADLIDTSIANLQTCYDIVAEKHTSTGENLWKIDPEALKTRLK